ncbi:hypothetical protein CRM90_28300 [Mycobacterium sp. ENV421]|nr:hypothetical protein CRM90_28300 [Mycobacterium sp. ENV421]
MHLPLVAVTSSLHTGVESASIYLIIVILYDGGRWYLGRIGPFCCADVDATCSADERTRQ